MHVHYIPPIPDEVSSEPVGVSARQYAAEHGLTRAGARYRLEQGVEEGRFTRTFVRRGRGRPEVFYVERGY